MLLWILNVQEIKQFLSRGLSLCRNKKQLEIR